MVRATVVSLSVTLLLLVLGGGCASSDETKSIPSHQCPSKAPKKTEAECKVEGDKSGCNVSRAIDGICSYEECDSQPACALFT
ncbi:MAG: hypothetical protein U0270_05005 [Labilithrix sp.]